ncbi:transglycosylase SLT domain-containing protein [Streptomyces sp. NPDC047072]|uniref:transglycosylase SLT domain-containing protein n=1 Tax=Streptomyces sp. NPDC047072 TaxID=3154809 RepID=UPI0033D8B180
MSSNGNEGEGEGGSHGPSAGDAAKIVRYALLIGKFFGTLASAVGGPVVAGAIVIICGFGVLLAPIIAIILLITGGGGGSSSEDDADTVYSISQGDGKGELDTSTIPDDDLVDTVQDAGEECDAIGPVVIAAQIAQGSAWNASMVGEHGEEGISQLPPAIFTKYGKDTDKNGKTSAFDAKDSIMAQARYMCDLAKEAQQIIDDTDTKASVLDLALAGYAVGMDAVREAKGIPNTNGAQTYVAGVRARFAMYEGYGDVPNDYGSSTSTPSDFTTPSNSPSGSSGASSPSPTDTSDDDSGIALPAPDDTTRPTT